MAQGIVVKIWNVSAGAGTRSASAQIKSSIEYIENPEKVGVALSLNTQSQVNQTLSYVTNDMKTVQGLYIGGRHISDITHATEEMMQVKEFFGKMGGRVATHGVISLDEKESDPNNAGKLMLLLEDLMKEVFPEHQVVYAVHTNMENLHIHFVLNTVGLDGKKIHMDKQFMRKVLEPAVNRLAIKYGFTPNEVWSEKPKVDEIPIDKQKIMLRKMVDYAIEQTDDIPSFVAYLRAQGLTVNVGKHISLQMEGMSRAMRTGKLGENYTPQRIVERMATKLDPLVFKGISRQAHYLPQKELVEFTPMKMKNYKDMSKEEKAKAVHLLRLGRNPWQESRQENWQIQNMSKQLNEVGYVYELVHFYSNGLDNANAAMREIIRRKEAIANEIKEVRKNLRQYKPLIDLYEEMKKHMVNAYLYDVCGRAEYVSDYMRYKELSDYMWASYQKTMDDVAELIADQKGQITYAKGQLAELSEQYKAIYCYVKEDKFRVDERGLSFYQAVGHGEALAEARDYGIYRSDIKFITAKNVEDIVIRVVTTPEIIDGKQTVSTTVTVIGKEDEIIQEFSSKHMGTKAFNEALFSLAAEYGLKDCQVGKKNIRKNVL